MERIIYIHLANYFLGVRILCGTRWLFMPSMLLLFSLSGNSQNFEKVYSNWTKLNEKITVCLLEVCSRHGKLQGCSVWETTNH